MTRRDRWWIAAIALMAWLLPGCAHLCGPFATTTCTTGNSKTDHPADIAQLPGTAEAGQKKFSFWSFMTGRARKDIEQVKVQDVPPDQQKKDHQQAKTGKPGKIEPDQGPLEIQLPDVTEIPTVKDNEHQILLYPVPPHEGAILNWPGGISDTEQQESVPPLPREVTGAILPPAEADEPPLVRAMRKFLDNRPEEAVELLKAYDQSNQDVFLRLLPVLAQMTHKKWDQLDGEEKSVLYHQLENLMSCLRSQTDLLIDQMCFCDEISSTGCYTACAEGHAFRARNGQQMSELVQIYVRLRNLSSEKRGNVYETRLSSSVEIVDASGKRLWFFDFQDRDRILRSHTPRPDHFNNYSFYVPNIPPGTYTLTIQVRDLTRPDLPRTAHRSLPFRVRQ